MQAAAPRTGGSRLAAQTGVRTRARVCAGRLAPEPAPGAGTPRGCYPAEPAKLARGVKNELPRVSGKILRQPPPLDSPGLGATGSAVGGGEAPGTTGAVAGVGGSLVCSHASCSGVNGSAGALSSGSDISMAVNGDRGDSAISVAAELRAV